MNLYKTHKSQWEKIREDGFPNLAEMSKYFTTAAEMNNALTYAHGTVENWVLGRNGISRSSEERAKKFLGEASQDTVVCFENPTTTKMFVINCTLEQEAKVEKLMRMLSIEMVEV
jgi:hypothetical protein